MNNEHTENLHDMDYDMPIYNGQEKTDGGMMPKVMYSPPDFNNGMAMPSGGVLTIPETLVNPAYTPAYLRGNIGKKVCVEFVLGDKLTERTGTLVEVGASYIVIETERRTQILCDIYSVRFVTFDDGVLYS